MHEDAYLHKNEQLRCLRLYQKMARIHVTSVGVLNKNLEFLVYLESATGISGQKCKYACRRSLGLEGTGGGLAALQSLASGS